MSRGTKSAVFDLPAETSPAVYALIDENGKKYIGSTRNLKQRLSFHRSNITATLNGKPANISASMEAAVKAGRVFRWEVLERLPHNATQAEILKAEQRHIVAAGGATNLYNTIGVSYTSCTPCTSSVNIH